MKLRRRVVGNVSILLGATIFISLFSVQASSQEEAARRGPEMLFSAPLVDAPGKTIQVVELVFGPNTAPPSTPENHRRGHRHPGSVFVYVTQGSVRLAVEGKPVQVVPTGGTFFEQPGDHHIITENVSATEPARAIAVMIVPEGEPYLTLSDSD